MRDNEITDIESDIQEVFYDFGDSENIAIRQFIKGDKNIYNESKKKAYGTPVVVTGRIRFNPKTDEVSDLGRVQEVNAIFSFITKDLRETGFMDEEGETKITVDDQIIYKEKRKFQVMNIIPSSMMGDKFLLYKIECKELK